MNEGFIIHLLGSIAGGVAFYRYWKGYRFNITDVLLLTVGVLLFFV